MRKRPWLEIVLVLAITALALWVRVYRLREIPPGLYGDEAVNGVDILDVLGGQHPIFFERNNGREPLFIYLQAVSVALLGATPFALRLTSAIIGALTVPAIYWMARETFARRTDRVWIAGWTAAFVAASYWHIIFSRIGFRAIMLPLMASLTFACFWRAWRRLEDGGRFPWASLCLCGLFCGASLYTYTAARVLPIVLVAMAGVGMWLNRGAPGFGRRALAGLAVVGVTSILVFTPLGVYFVSHPGSFAAHSVEVSITDTLGSEQLSKPAALLLNTANTLGMFGIMGDSRVRHNPGQRPATDLMLSLWLFGGILLAIHNRRSLPYVFVLTWFVLMLLPGILSEGAPHFLRALGAAPPTFLLVVLAMLEAGRWLARRTPRVACWLPLPFFLLSTVSGLHAYFITPALDPMLQGRLRWDNTTWLVEDAVPIMADRVHSEGIWLLPYAQLFGVPANTESILQFLVKGVNVQIVSTVEPAVSSELLAATEGRQRAVLLRVKHFSAEPEGTYVFTDYKHLAAFLLNKYGMQTSEEDLPQAFITSYDVPASATYRITTAEQPAEFSFGGKALLTSYAYGRTATGQADPEEWLDRKEAPAGDQMWVVLRWKALQPLDNTQFGELNRYPSGEDVTALSALKASLYLVDAEGHLAGQVDDPIASDKYLIRDVWQTGEAGSSYHILPTLPAIAPGRYGLYLAVYDAKAKIRYPAIAGEGTLPGSAAYLGEVEVTPAVSPAAVAPQQVAPSLEPPLADMALLGYDLPRSRFNPGDTLPLTLYWQAAAAPAADYTVRTQLRPKTAPGAPAAESEPEPVGGDYATGRWRPDEIIRDWHDMALPPTIAPGTYDLTLEVSVDSKPIARTSLQEVEITGRPRSFEAPDIQHPMSLRLGDRIEFLGYRADPAVRAGQALPITLYWRARDEAGASYTVFVHILDEAGNLVAQQDSPPGQGTLETTGWAPGEYVTDEYRVLLDPGLPPGSYRIAIGMYDPQTGARLAVSDSTAQIIGDRILLPQPVQLGPD